MHRIVMAKRPWIWLARQRTKSRQSSFHLRCKAVGNRLLSSGRERACCPLMVIIPYKFQLWNRTPVGLFFSAIAAVLAQQASSPTADNGSPFFDIPAVAESLRFDSPLPPFDAKDITGR